MTAQFFQIRRTANSLERSQRSCTRMPNHNTRGKGNLQSISNALSVVLLLKEVKAKWTHVNVEGKRFNKPSCSASLFFFFTSLGSCHQPAIQIRDRDSAQPREKDRVRCSTERSQIHTLLHTDDVEFLLEQTTLMAVQGRHKTIEEATAIRACNSQFTKDELWSNVCEREQYETLSSQTRIKKKKNGLLPFWITMTMTLVAHYGGVGRMCSWYENKQFTNAKKKYSSEQGCGGNVDFHKQKEGGQSGLKTLKRSKTVTLSFFFLWIPSI